MDILRGRSEPFDFRGKGPVPATNSNGDEPVTGVINSPFRQEESEAFIVFSIGTCPFNGAILLLRSIATLSMCPYPDDVAGSLPSALPSQKYKTLRN